jgi:kynureninase
VKERTAAMCFLPSPSTLRPGMEHLTALLAAPGAAPLDPAFAAALDERLGASRRAHFLLPTRAPAPPPPAAGAGAPPPLVYLCGNSLGLQPARCAGYVGEELAKWGAMGVEGHFTAPRPWVSTDEGAAPGLAALVGAASPSEVVAMGTLTSNLHHLLCAFYRPAGARTRILLEAGAFPSDAHAAASQAALHGLDPRATLLHPASTRTEDVCAAIAAAGDTLALVLLPGVQYYSGHLLDVRAVTAAAHAVGAVAGWDLAHAIGNAPLALHDWGVDFAVWCSYKYLNSGPGGMAGAFVHARHGAGGAGARFRLAGWWGHRAEDRFVMATEHVAAPGAQGYALSNPCVLAMAALRASLDEFAAAGGLPALRARSLALTGYLEAALLASGLFARGGGGGAGEILTPADPSARGAQLSLELRQAPGGPTLDDLCACLREEGVVVDERRVRSVAAAAAGAGAVQRARRAA